MYVLHRVGSWKNVISNTCLAFKSKRSYTKKLPWLDNILRTMTIVVVKHAFSRKKLQRSLLEFLIFHAENHLRKVVHFFPSDSLLLQQTSAMVHLQQNYANQMMLTHSYVVIHVARSCNNSSLLSSDDFPHEKWEFPRPSLKFFSWKSMFNNNNRRPQKISLVWYSLCLGDGCKGNSAGD